MGGAVRKHWDKKNFQLVARPQVWAHEMSVLVSFCPTHSPKENTEGSVTGWGPAGTGEVTGSCDWTEQQPRHSPVRVTGST